MKNTKYGTTPQCDLIAFGLTGGGRPPPSDVRSRGTFIPNPEYSTGYNFSSLISFVGTPLEKSRIAILNRWGKDLDLER